ncbi:hypothetical protein URS_2230 [Acinetobacter ursingii]|nr:hypothetical protein URS_2230 [Acinetobacter ursingii]
MSKTFLNGVCRHEHKLVVDSASVGFLNGVCRHEHWCLCSHGVN